MRSIPLVMFFGILAIIVILYTSSTLPTKSSITAGNAYQNFAAAGETMSPSAGSHRIIWSFTESTDKENKGTFVSVNIDGISNPVALFPGTCAEIGKDGTVSLLNSEISASQCWDGKKGAEIGVFKSEKGFTIQKTSLNTKDKASASYRTKFEVVSVL